jgi:3-dehydroquinate synthase
MKTLEKILEFLAENHFSREDIAVALGGGVVGDVVGFASAVYTRGIPYVQIPTTLLSAVDSSVGGKTAVNLKAGKNMAGAFHQPALVLCDTGILRELPENLIQEGMAEIIKYGVISDSRLFEMVSKKDALKNTDGIVERCVSIKSGFVEQDEFDAGKRQMLNFGHTIGHAVEKLSNFSVSHGHAVSIGMVIMSRASWKLGVSDEDCTLKIKKANSLYSLPTGCPFTSESLLDAMLSDKKRRGDSITLGLPKSIGDCILNKVAIDDLGKWLSAGIDEEGSK